MSQYVPDNQESNGGALFTTGYTRNAMVHGGMLDLGMNFRSMPFTLEQLVAKVRNELDAG